jgi:hypothetical protein
LLESKLVYELTNQGYFVEPNQVVRDVRTGKSREIDIVAEHYSYDPEHEHVHVKTYFIAEIVNNKFPVVLLTQRPSSPNADSESYIKFACTPEPNPFYDKLDIYDERRQYEDNLFSQYCALTQKKGEARELMASHPEDLYGSLQKLSEYIEEDLASWAERSDSPYWRLFFWHPMLVLGGQLVTARTLEDGSIALIDTASGFLEFNWHEGEERRTTVIEFVTVEAFFDRLAEMVRRDASMEERLHAIRLAWKEASEI